MRAVIQIVGIKGMPLVKRGDEISSLILDALDKQKLQLQEDDILVIAQCIVSKAEGRIVKLSDIKPSATALEIAHQTRKDPRLVELILSESRRIEMIADNNIIVETWHGFVCANAGIDSSNSGGEGRVTLLPADPDKSARRIRRRIEDLSGVKVGIIISDTHGRPFREGAINIAIGIAGVPPIISFAGKKDLYGYKLRTTRVSIGDELASAAELVTGESDEGIPVALIRGYEYTEREGTANELVRHREKDLFRRNITARITNPNLSRRTEK